MEPGWQPARPWLLTAAAGHLTWRDAHFLNIPLLCLSSSSCQTELQSYRAGPVITGPGFIINTNTQSRVIYRLAILSLSRIIEKFSKHLEDH